MTTEEKAKYIADNLDAEFVIQHRDGCRNAAPSYVADMILKAMKHGVMGDANADVLRALTEISKHTCQIKGAFGGEEETVPTRAAEIALTTLKSIQP